MNWLIIQLRKERWSPYIAGALLGVTSLLAALGRHLLGVSGAFERLAGLLGQAAAPALFDNVYFDYTVTPGIGWCLVLALGVFLGGLVGAWSSGTLHLRIADEPEWARLFGAQPWKRWAVVFAGAVLLEYGAGVAGGCIASLAISGGMLLAPAAFLFLVALLTAGVASTYVLYRRRF